MTVQATAEAGRRLIESLMTSTCTIRARSTGTTTDPDTGEVVAALGEVIYAGKCRVRPQASRGAGDFGTPGAEAFRVDHVVSVPFSATGIRAGHRVTIDSSPDADLVGLEVEVQPVRFGGDHISARRLACQEVS